MQALHKHSGADVRLERQRAQPVQYTQRDCGMGPAPAPDKGWVCGGSAAEFPERMGYKRVAAAAKRPGLWM